MPPSFTADSPLSATPSSSASESLAHELHLPEPIARLLLARGYTDADAARRFLHPSLDHLHDPRAMHGMAAAVDRIRRALLAREPILIYGDYDVDGTVATVLLKTACERAAAALGAIPDIRYHIPHRIREGYGMRESRIAEAAAEGVRLVVSVDTGIRAHAAAEEAARLGLDLIVTDHHLPDETNGSPVALAVLNPNQPHCEYPCKDLCGAAVAFKLAQALLEASARDDAQPDLQLARLRTKTFPSFLKLLALATIADSVPLTGENRTIASIGLRELRSPAQLGLRALMELAGIDITRPISATDVGFRLAPRLNAAGRMEVASDVVELFLTRDPATARALAEKLHRLNDERRATEATALREIEARIESLLASPDGLPACLVLDDSGPATSPGAPSVATASSSSRVGTYDASHSPTRWHRGVVGILASRVVDRTGRPALVLAHEDGVAHGSGRSVNGFHLLDAITAAHQQADNTLFSRFGGHAHAVGFALPSDNVQQLRDRLALIAADRIGLTPVVEPLHCDLEIQLADITRDLLAAFEQLAPFGLGNPDPLFLTRGARLLAPPRTISDRHLRLSFEDADGSARFSGIAWGRRTQWPQLALEQRWSPGDHFDIAYHLRRNWHPDFGGWELELIALHHLPQDSTSSPV